MDVHMLFFDEQLILEILFIKYQLQDAVGTSISAYGYLHDIFFRRDIICTYSLKT